MVTERMHSAVMRFGLLSHGWLVLTAVVAAASASSCAGREPRAQPEPPRVSSVQGATSSSVAGVADPVIVMTIDGVRWQEIFEGTDASRTSRAPLSARALTPNLHRLGTERGAFVGAPGRGTISATGPEFISLPGYNEILSGRAPSACSSNECGRTTRPTLLDEAHRRGARVAAFASWERLDRAITMSSPHAFRVDAGRGEPPTEALAGSPESRPDRLTAAAALDYYEAERPDVFYLGLGDPDEHAHHGDYDAYVDSIRFADEVIGRFIQVLDRDERGRRTHLVISPDHGRSKDFRSHGGFASPEAAQVWMVASGPRVVARGLVSTSRARHLADIAPTLRQILGLPTDESPMSGAPLEELFD